MDIYGRGVSRSEARDEDQNSGVRIRWDPNWMSQPVRGGERAVATSQHLKPEGTAEETYQSINLREPKLIATPQVHARE